jgi:hypothetical protein
VLLYYQRQESAEPASGRPKAYLPLLLGPGMGQRAGELCGGEICRRGAVKECRHDPGREEGKRRQQWDMALDLLVPTLPQITVAST